MRPWTRKKIQRKFKKEIGQLEKTRSGWLPDLRGKVVTLTVLPIEDRVWGMIFQVPVITVTIATH